jgi:hypothetical protein
MQSRQPEVVTVHTPYCRSRVRTGIVLGTHGIAVQSFLYGS